jgi:hypothetical protein
MQYISTKERVFTIELTETELRTIVQAYGSCSYDRIKEKHDLKADTLYDKIIDLDTYHNIFRELNMFAEESL